MDRVPGTSDQAIHVGVRSTAASCATPAEMAFPVAAAVLGVGLLGTRLTGTRWLGLAVVIVSVGAIGLRERTERPAVRVARGA
ncbi:MAG: drug/metabolite transporter, family [Pseudonocardiales bacterium]|jgi:DME family drug/metabolite transporter|nr:drug/metabolite transporter, family [Pseudonocardiales bacterium]